MTRRPGDESDDWALVAAWAAGEPDAAATLIDRHQPRLFRFFRNKVADPQSCSDLIQQTFLGMLESAGRARPDHAFSTWLFAIGRNVLFAHYRRRTKRAREDADYGTLCASELEATSMSSIIARRREAQAVMDALRDVPVDDQILLELRFFERNVAREIAELLDIPRGSVHGRLEAALARLRDRVAARLDGLKDDGGPVTDEQLTAWVEEVRTMAYPGAREK